MSGCQRGWRLAVGVGDTPELELRELMNHQKSHGGNLEWQVCGGVQL